MKKHVLQSEMWGTFKQEYGTPVIKAGGVVYTKHKIPFTNYFYGYCPRVNPFDVDFEALKSSLKTEGCIALHFDVPNVVVGSKDETPSRELFEKYCQKSSRDEFAKANFLIDLTKNEQDIFSNMHKKHRYNIKYSQNKGVVVREGNTEEDFDNFYNLYKQTGIRQHFYYRSRNYLYKIWNIFKKENAVKILLAEYQKEVLDAWLLFIYDDVLYYAYGGSSESHKQLHAGCLIGWETILYGKRNGCVLFDMWGASYDMNDIKDPYHGFSLFKSKFGAEHVKYIDSYDLVLNGPLYIAFTNVNTLRWKVLNFLR